MSTRVVIIGAGMAGIAAGQHLHKSGAAVIILEARDRIGGRMWTSQTLGHPIDLGASWIHGVRGNPITKLAQKFNLNTIPTDYENLEVYDFDGRRLSVEPLLSEFWTLLDETTVSYAEELDEDMSLATGLDQLLVDRSLNTEQRRVLDWVLALNVEANYAADIEQLSLKSYYQDEYFGGGDHFMMDGYHQIVEKLAKGLDIRLSDPVTEIDYSGETTHITTESATYKADFVIVTVPLGLLKAGSIKFTPDLPQEKQGAIDRLEMGLLNKIVLQYPNLPEWPASREVIGYASDTRGEFSTFMNLHAYNESPILMGFLGGSYALAQEDRSDEEIIAHAQRILTTIYGNQLPDPIAYLVTRWASDPFSYGSYSYVPLGADFSDYEQMGHPVANRLLFAGEATNRQYPATVHGAYLSGVREAERVLGLIGMG